MANAEIILIADDVTNELNTASPPLLPSGVTAIRDYLTVLLAGDLSALWVIVTPRNELTAIASRGVAGKDSKQFFVDVTIVQHIADTEASTAKEQADDLVKIAEDIYNHWRRKESKGYRVQRVDREQIFDPQKMEEQSIFFGVQTIVFGGVS